MSEGTVRFPMATSASRAFVRTTGSGLASAETNSGIPVFTFFGAILLLPLIDGVMADPFVFPETDPKEDYSASPVAVRGFLLADLYPFRIVFLLVQAKP
jgi:hypothetical protein